MEIQPTIIKKIKKLRAQKEWSQLMLAKKSGISQSHICKIETGIVGVSKVVQTKLAKAFKMKKFI
jgi:transcriptional regulator with XRE-family HTH domain